MTDRRSLTTAVNPSSSEVDPEVVRSFVTQNQDNVSSAATRRGADTKAQPPKLSMETDPLARGNLVKSRIRPVGLIPVTVRLRPEIAGALKRASLERELAGETVYTQQDIVEQALQPWLEREGIRD